MPTDSSRRAVLAIALNAVFANGDPHAKVELVKIAYNAELSGRLSRADRLDLLARIPDRAMPIEGAQALLAEAVAGNQFFWPETSGSRAPGLFRPLPDKLIAFVMQRLLRAELLMLTLVCRGLRNFHAHLLLSDVNSCAALDFERRLQPPAVLSMEVLQGDLHRLCRRFINPTGRASWMLQLWDPSPNQLAFVGTLPLLVELVQRRAGWMQVASQLEHVPNLSCLDLRYNNFGDAGATAVARALKHVPQLSVLDLSGASFGAAGATAVADALQHAPQLSELRLENNNINAVGATALAGTLGHVPQLRVLNLAGPRQTQPRSTRQTHEGFGDVGATSLADALQHTPQLSVLDLENQRIGAAGGTAISRALEHISQLSILNLADNRMGAPGAISIASALERVPQLNVLDLGWVNDIDSELERAIHAAVTASGDERASLVAALAGNV